jgi:hypothetical protein
MGRLPDSTQRQSVRALAPFNLNSRTVCTMKITVRISDNLVKETRKLAKKEKTTLQALVEEGLRRVIAARNQPAKFRLREATFKGQGLQRDVAGRSWDEIRALAYEGRGG